MKKIEIIIIDMERGTITSFNTISQNWETATLKECGLLEDCEGNKCSRDEIKQELLDRQEEENDHGEEEIKQQNKFFEAEYIEYGDTYVPLKFDPIKLEIMFR